MIKIESIYQASAGLTAVKNASHFYKEYMPKYDKSKKLYISDININYIDNQDTFRWYYERLVYTKKPSKEQFIQDLKKLCDYYEKALKEF